MEQRLGRWFFGFNQNPARWGGLRARPYLYNPMEIKQRGTRYFSKSIFHTRFILHMFIQEMFIDSQITTAPVLTTANFYDRFFTLPED